MNNEMQNEIPGDAMTRRETLRMAAAAGAVALCFTCMGGSSAHAEDAGAQQVGGNLDAGPASAIAEGVSDKFAKPGGVMIYRKGNKLFASQSMCTHRNCFTKVVENQLRCPCHGSRFDEDGVPTKGPASKALPRFAVKIDDAGHLIVDKSTKFEQDKWDDAKASATLPAMPVAK